MDSETVEFEKSKLGEQTEIEKVDVNKLLEIFLRKAELKNKIDVRKSHEEASGTDIRKSPRSLAG